MTSITRSTPSTPICKPQLPPLTDTNAGALQPFEVRHVAMPRPCLPPKMKPPLIRSGTTIMHLALSNTSSGIPLSGAAMIALSTPVDDFRRSTVSCFPDPAHAHVPAKPINATNTTDITFFMNAPSKAKLRRKDFRWADLAQDLKETEVIQISSIMMDDIRANKWSQLLTLVN